MCLLTIVDLAQGSRKWVSKTPPGPYHCWGVSRISFLLLFFLQVKSNQKFAV